MSEKNILYVLIGCILLLFVDYLSTNQLVVNHVEKAWHAAKHRIAVDRVVIRAINNVEFKRADQLEHDDKVNSGNLSKPNHSTAVPYSSRQDVAVLESGKRSFYGECKVDQAFLCL